MSVKQKPYLIGICGGSASGKTTAAYFITQFIGEENCLLFSLDNYFYGPNDEERKHIQDYNFDRPEALDLDLAYHHLTQLINNETIEMPVYSFNVSRRMDYTKKVSPKKVIIFEGIFALYEKRVRDLMDLKLFFDLDSDIRLFRRISRDISDRSRVLDTVLERYFTFVKPAFDLYIKPTRKYADIVIPQGTYSSLPIEIISYYLQTSLNISVDSIKTKISIESNTKEFFSDKKIDNLFTPKEEKDIKKFNKIINYVIRKINLSYFQIYIEEIIDYLFKMVNELNKNGEKLLFLDETQLSSKKEEYKENLKKSEEKTIINIFAPILLEGKEIKINELQDFIKEIKGDNIKFQIVSVFLSQERFDELNKISIGNNESLSFITIYFGEKLLDNPSILEQKMSVDSNITDLAAPIHLLTPGNFIEEFQKRNK